jgi:hypothetical protein
MSVFDCNDFFIGVFFCVFSAELFITEFMIIFDIMIILMVKYLQMMMNIYIDFNTMYLFNITRLSQRNIKYHKRKININYSELISDRTTGEYVFQVPKIIYIFVLILQSFARNTASTFELFAKMKLFFVLSVFFIASSIERIIADDQYTYMFSFHIIHILLW